MTSNHKVYFYTGLSILFWAGSATVFKIALSTLSPLMLLWSSSLISLIIMSLLLTGQGQLKLLRSLSARQWASLLALGILNPFLYYIILFKAYDLLPGQVAMSLNYLWPVVLALLSVPVLGHKLKLRSLLAISLSFAGALIIATRGEMVSISGISGRGVILALASTLIWALYWLLSARIQVAAIVKLFAGFLSGTALTVLYACFMLDEMLPVSGVPWGALLYVGLLEMGLTFFLWLKALQLAENAAQVGNLIYLTPFLSLLFLALLLDEPIHGSTLTGLVVIISGILAQQYWSDKKSV